MKLRQLEYFVSVAEELHFTKAATKSGVSQPTLSSQIRTLERELGVVLLHRDTHEVALTRAGQSFLISARLILDQVDAAKRSLEGESGQTLRVSTLGTGGTSIERRIIDAYHTAYPSVAISIVLEDWGKGGEAIRSGIIDIAFMATPPHIRFVDHTGLMIKRLRLDPRVALMRDDHDLAGRSQLRLRDIAPYKLVAPTGRKDQRDWWLVNPRPDGSEAMYTTVVANAGELLEAVMLTGDISITTDTVAQAQARSDMVFLPLLDVEPAEISLGWSSSSINPSVQHFVQVAALVAST